MHFYSWIGIGLLFFSNISVGKAQDDKLLKNQLEVVFKDLRPAERKTLVEESLVTWTSAFFTEAELDTITVAFKNMQKIHVTAPGDIKNFAQCVNAFCRQKEKENLWVWMTGLKKAMKAKEQRITQTRNYLQTTQALVCKGVLFNGAAHRWLVKGKYRWTAEPQLQIEVPEAVVSCQTGKDSIFIYNTDIIYELNASGLKGQGGRVYWNTPDTMYADLSIYRIDLSLSEYAADSVRFVYEKKYKGFIKGKLRDNALKYVRPKDGNFPEFTSYEIDLKVDTVFSSISFQGGISYRGIKLTGFGSDTEPACVHVSPNDTTHFYVYARRFSIDTGRIIAGVSRIYLPLDSGSFTHPNVNFSYTNNNRTLTVKRITEQSLNVPFRDDYHQILFDVEQFVWVLDSSYMEMSMSSRSDLFKATVESLNFFNDNMYDQMQGIDAIHPLNGLHKAAVVFRSNTFTLADYAELMKKPIDQLRKQVITLSYDDFLEYNESRDEVKLKSRLFDYTQARIGKKDYDNIRFASHPHDSRINATLDLRNYNLKIYGVDKFTISEAKDIYVEPSDKSVLMLKNRDMEFNGKLKAGMFDMFGNKLYFSYDKYTINLTQVDSTGMFLTDQNTGKRGEKVKSIIRDVAGNIMIDKPGNKSGKKKTEGFPVFHSAKESYVYFDDPDIRDGVYHKDKFYFVIQPYTLKDINDTEKFRYAFKGTLVSNIVPDIQDTLLLMRDNTLGMNYQTPASGIQLYDKGKLKSHITLDRNGLVANGRVDINHSNFNSPAIVLMPDSMLSETPLFVVNKIDGQRPEAKGEKVRVRYMRQEGNLLANSSEKPFEVYQKRVAHRGTLFVYDDRMDAAGQLEVKGAKLTSNLLHLASDNILSEHSDLQLSSFANKNIQLNTANVRANVDLIQNKGKFMNNEDANMADFPSNRYRCSFKSFTWYMNEAYLNIGIEDEKELQRIWQIEDPIRMPEQGKNIFVSTDKACDSLQFIAPLAKYNLNTGDIFCQWVNHIDLANGRFYPDEGKIAINGLGDVAEFKNAVFLCERTDRTKMLDKVSLKLKGRYTFNGSGDYLYTNQDKKKTVIRFTEIGTDTSRFIYARMTMQPEANFELNEGFIYKGNIYLYSKQKDLFFKGYTRLTADDTYLKYNWLKVNNYFAANDIRIPVKVENRNDKDQRIYNAVFLNVDKTVKPYAAFQSNRLFYNDELLLGGQGELTWNKAEKKYYIQDSLQGRYYHLCYNPSDYTVSGFGRIGMELEISGITQQAAGNISYNLKEEELHIDNLLYTLDFQLLPKMQNVILRDFAGKRKKSIDVDSSLVAKMYAIYGKGLVPLALKQMGKNVNNIPDSLDRFLVLDSLHFSWEADRRSYISSGKAVVKSVFKRPVEEEYNVAMELVRRWNGGNQIYLYIYNDEMWYYFEYADRSLYTLSSNGEYNEIVRNEKAEKKIIQDKEKTTLYTITLCPDSKRTRFLKRMGL